MDIEQGFWQAYQKFLKIPLMTEQPHPLTADLSTLAHTDLQGGYQLLKKLDLLAIKTVVEKKSEINRFQFKMRDVIKRTGRIILIGCGASGRIAAQLEYWWRYYKPQQQNAVAAMLAGGDITLIEALESVEDSPEFAAIQMATLALCPQDLVIGLSASGESPFILAALKFAQLYIKEKPILICCNPVECLIERNATHPAQDTNFEVMSLVVGEMALTGSTRMQATTAMTLFLILTLLPEYFNVSQQQLRYTAMPDCQAEIKWEAQHFAAGEQVGYVVPGEWSLPVLADLTERAPTFNIRRLFHHSDPQDLSPLKLVVADAETAGDAWLKILARPPKALDLQGFANTKLDYLYGYDLSKPKRDICWQFDLRQQWGQYLQGLSLLELHFSLRLHLVNHSTLLMGRLGFYSGNLMTSLKPANFKLIDRAIRYVQFLADRQTGQRPDYKEIARALFLILPTLQPGESIVFRVLELFVP